MDDINNNKISQFLDNELNTQESLELLEQIKQQPKLNQKLQRYQITTEVLNAETCLLAKPDFLEGIQKNLTSEPHYLSATKTKSKPKTASEE